MKLKILLSLIFVGIGFTLLGSTKVAAETCTWSGVANSNWSNSSNWFGCVVSNGDDVVFESGATLSTFNDIVGLQLNSITFPGSDAFTIAGNNITLNGDVTVADPSAGHQINVGLTLGSNVALGAAHYSALTLNGNITLDATGGVLSLAGVVSGNGGIEIAGGDTFFSVANTFTGDIMVTSGSLAAENGNALGVVGNALTLADTGVLYLNTGINIQQQIIFQGSGSISSDNATSTLSGPVTIAGDTDIDTASGGTLIFSGVIDGPGRFIRTGGGSTIEFTGGAANTFSGGLEIQDGSVILNKSTGEAVPDGGITIGDSIGAAGSAQLTTSNSDQIGDDVFVHVKSDGIYNLSGNNDNIGDLQVDDGTVDTGNADISTGDISLTGGILDSGAGTIFMNGTIQGGSSLIRESQINGILEPDATSTTISGTAGSSFGIDFFINAVIQGDSVLTFQGDTIELTGDNTYTADTILNDTALFVTSTSAFGNTVGKTIVNGTSFIIFDTASGHTDENFEINGNGAGPFGTLNALGSSVQLRGDIVLDTDTTFGSFSGKSFLIGGGISGNHSIYFNAVTGGGNSFFLVEGSNTFTGNVTISSDSILFSGSPNALSISNSVNIFPGGILHMGQYGIGDGFDAVVGSVAGSGIFEVESGGNGGNVSIGNSSSDTFAGEIQGDGDIFKVGSGTWTLTGGNSNTGHIGIDEGTILFNGPQQYQNITLTGGTLGGNGTVGNVGGIAGAVSPGSSPSAITINGDLTLNSAISSVIELNGLAAGTEYDQLQITGVASLNNSPLVLSLGFTPTVGDTFTIVIVEVGGSINGTFAGLPDGTVFSVGGSSFRINYDVSTVILTAVGAPPLSETGINLPLSLMTLVLLLSFGGLFLIKRNLK